MEQNALTILNNATQMLAEVRTINDAKQLMDVAAAAKYYAQKHGLGRQAVDYAREIEVEADIKLGEFLAEMDKNKGGRPSKKTASPGEAVSETPNLKSMGISDKLSSESQALAALPEKEKAKVRSGKKSKKSAVKESMAAKQKETIAASVVKIQEKAIIELEGMKSLLPYLMGWTWNCNPVPPYRRYRTRFCSATFEVTKRWVLNKKEDIRRR